MKTLVVVALVVAVLGVTATASAVTARFFTLRLGDSVAVSGTTVICRVQTGPTTGKDIICGTRRAKYTVLISDKVVAVLKPSGDPAFLRLQP